MTMHRLVTTLLAPVLGIVLSVGTLSTTAHAAPTKIGPVANLTLTASAAPGGYTVTSDWTPLAGATAYKVTLTTAAGATLASVTQTAPPWSAVLAIAPNTQIKVSVQPMDGKKPGIAASAVYTLPDIAPPLGTFTVTRNGMDATITQTSLSDDATPAAEIKRFVSWGDGSPEQVWQTGTELTHNYAALGRYVPTVRLTDNSGNSVTLTLRAAVFGDTAAPVGNFASGPSAAFAGWTKVTLSLESLTDNYTPSDLVQRTVSWGDGTTEAWKAGATLTHVYAVAGTFTPSVVLLDEADNSSKVTADPITVTVDGDGPVVKIAKPKAAAQVRSWRKVKGTAKDAGVGVASVGVVAIQKRDGKWYAYSGATKKWTKVATKGKAWKKAVPVAATLDKAAWTARLTGLRKGSLIVRATGTDHVANASKLASRSALLLR